MAHVVEAQGLFGEQERQFERDAVEPVGGGREAELGFPDGVAPIDIGDLALLVLVGGDSVIVEDGGADDGEEGAGGGEGEEARRPARPRRSSPARPILALPQGAPPAAAVGSELAGADAADGVIGERRRDQAAVVEAHPRRPARWPRPARRRCARFEVAVVEAAPAAAPGQVGRVRRFDVEKETRRQIFRCAAVLGVDQCAVVEPDVEPGGDVPAGGRGRGRPRRAAPRGPRPCRTGRGRRCHRPLRSTPQGRWAGAPAVLPTLPTAGRRMRRRRRRGPRRRRSAPGLRAAICPCSFSYGCPRGRRRGRPRPVVRRARVRGRRGTGPHNSRNRNARGCATASSGPPGR